MKTATTTKNRRPRGKAITWRRALIAVALGGAVSIPSCSEDPAQLMDVLPPQSGPDLADPPGGRPGGEPDEAPRAIGVDPYLGYTR